MATTVLQAFQELKQRLEITDLQTSTVASRQKSVREVLNGGLTVLDDFLTGSYSRQTMIAPLNEADIDIFAVLDSKYFHRYNQGQNGGQAGLLDLVKRALQKTYTRTPDISRNGQAVTIRFSDFSVDVVPGFNRSGGGYLIPNSLKSSWLSTDPKMHVELLSSANKKQSGNLVPLIKMIKGWNKSHGDYFRSFHLEVLAMSVLSNVAISDFPSGTRYYFGKCVDAVASQNPDPAGYGGDVGNYIVGDKVEKARAKFRSAYELALRAESSAQAGKESEAMGYWSKLFGRYFPTYG